MMKSTKATIKKINHYKIQNFNSKRIIFSQTRRYLQDYHKTVNQKQLKTKVLKFKMKNQ